MTMTQWRIKSSAWRSWKDRETNELNLIRNRFEFRVISKVQGRTPRAWWCMDIPKRNCGEVPELYREEVNLGQKWREIEKQIYGKTFKGKSNNCTRKRHVHHCYKQKHMLGLSTGNLASVSHSLPPPDPETSLSGILFHEYSIMLHSAPIFKKSQIS